MYEKGFFITYYAEEHCNQPEIEKIEEAKRIWNSEHTAEKQIEFEKSEENETNSSDDNHDNDETKENIIISLEFNSNFLDINSFFLKIIFEDVVPMKRYPSKLNLIDLIFKKQRSLR